MRDLLVYTSLEGEMTALWEPFAWVDPFEEAEFYACRWAALHQRRKADIDALREDHARETAWLRAQLEATVKTAMDLLALKNIPPPIIVMDHKS